jgi:hypothetical protein
LDSSCLYFQQSLVTCIPAIVSTITLVPFAEAMEPNGNGTPAGDIIDLDIVTLTRFLTEEQSKHKEATGDFT